MLETEKDKKLSLTEAASSKKGTNSHSLILDDNRLEASIQRKQKGGLLDNRTVDQPFQRKENLELGQRANNTGLPDKLKSGIENLSGIDMSATKVHYNSNKPAQLNAYAYAQGSDIHLASGQEKHLPHEAWHVVQQKQGRVIPTIQMKEQVNINDDIGLEKEADVMGEKALAVTAQNRTGNSHLKTPEKFVKSQPAYTINQFNQYPVQRVVNIDDIAKKPLPPTGKDANMIWDEIRIQLLNLSINPYGLKTNYYLPMLKDRTREDDYSTILDFQNAFIKKIADQFKSENDLAEAEKGLPAKNRTKRSVRRFYMARPPWPKEYREQLGARPGDDIRHVVRNATIKRALDYEAEFLRTAGWDESRLLGYYQAMAKAVDAPLKDHSLEEIKAIYHRVYLHLGNLFPGPGAVNQAIGFSSDPITKYGEHLKGQGDTLVREQEVVHTIWSEINSRVKANKTKASKMDPITATRFLKGLDHYQGNLKTFLQNQSALWIHSYGIEKGGQFWVKADEIAQDVIDIGDNFGFDLILASNDNPKVRERHAALIQIEIALQNKKFIPGTGGLGNIFCRFLEVPASLVKGDVMSQDAGLVFPVGRTARLMKQIVKRKGIGLAKKKSRIRVGAGAPIYMAGVLEYITAELVELAGNEADNRGSKRITEQDLLSAVKKDSELNQLLHEAVKEVEEEDSSDL